jgi:hypothetical protein
LTLPALWKSLGQLTRETGKLREEKPASLILGVCLDGRDKTLLPFPDKRDADGNGALGAPLN